MKLDNKTKKQIDDFFNSKTPEELYELALKYRMKELDEALNMRIVNRSIGRDTKPVLMATQEELDSVEDICDLCKHKTEDVDKHICCLCRQNLSDNQYYG